MRQLCLLALSLTLLQPVAAQVLRVDQHASQARLNGSTYSVVLAASSQANFRSAVLKLAVLSPNDLQLAAASASVQLRTGANKLSSSVTLPEPPKDPSDRLWYRLSYTVTAQGRELAHGILPLFNSVQDFVLRVSAPATVQPGRKFFVRVHTSHPVLGSATGGVSVSAQVQTDSDRVIASASGRTDAGGYAVLGMSVPKNLNTDDLEIRVDARRGEVQKTAENDLKVGTLSHIFVQTDKPLYQPGQALHIRALAFDDSHRALSGKKIDLQVQDQDGTTVFRQERITSRFGVVSCDWTIPERVKLGEYQISAQVKPGGVADQGDNSSDDDLPAAEDRRSIRISRYELPTFVVNAKPDRSYYLPEQKPSVEIDAAYLFGKPVPKASVRISQLEERSWNFAKQKWEIDEGQPISGTTDEQGKFSVSLDVSNESAKLDESSYRKFRDITYTAYVTDPSTGRTEERRFDVRITKYPIHVYYVPRDSSRRGLPEEFFISTSYADGSPAQCDVEVRAIAPDGSEQIVATAQTSRFGVARVRDVKRGSWDQSKYLPLVFVARDRKGATGVSKEDIWAAGETNLIRVITKKTILAPEEPIEAEIHSNFDGDMFLVLSSENKALRSFVVRLRHHSAIVRIPYDSDFVGQLTLSAITMRQENNYWGDYGPSSSRSVIYPQRHDLKIALHLDRSEYQPGQNAEATVQVRTPEGAAIPSVIGAVVFDKAVEERARIDEDLHQSFGFADYGGWWYEGGAKLANLTRADLDQVDTREPVPEDLDVAADFLLNSYNSASGLYFPVFGGEDEDTRSPSDVYKDEINRVLQPLLVALDADERDSATVPRNRKELDTLLQRHHLTWSNLRDPWGSEFIPRFSLDPLEYVLDVYSPGPDKRSATDDDFSVLHRSIGFYSATERQVTRALQDYHHKTGAFVRDVASLRTALANIGIDFSKLIDPWGRPYLFEFDINGPQFTVTAKTRGEDAKPGQEYVVGRSAIDYFAESRTAIDKLLPARVQAAGNIPSTADEFKSLLLPEIRLDNLRDPYGRPYMVRTAEVARYSDRAVRNNQQVKTEPVTVWNRLFRIRSSGRDGIPDNEDDFNVAVFSAVVSEVNLGGKTSAPSVHVLFAGNTGGINGIVTDPTGAIVANAKVTAVNANNGVRYESTTDSTGSYVFRDLVPGLYDVSAYAPGFMAITLRGIIVRSQEAVEVNATLRVAAATETVEVSANEVQVNTESVSITNSKRQATTDLAQRATVTPRLRQYFPETLLWQPSIETDRNGRAHISWKFADNLTTWKISLIASTLDGRLTSIDKEVKSFQPFFVEHDPPKVLTLGDQISLPVVVRNYTNKAEQVKVEMPSADWFRSSSGAIQEASLTPGGNAKLFFPFEAIAATSAGTQRVLATGARVGDAIERSVRVHPDGAELSHTEGRIVNGHTRWEFEVPAEVIPGSLRVDLKIYPDLLAHVGESLEGMLERPWGCGEQTISSTYPSVLLLKFEKESKRPLGSLHQRAMRYLDRGYARLLTYADPSGGFTYWGHGEPDLALTAYALSFLHDASEFMPVDPDIVGRARAWLLKHQNADGSWTTIRWYRNYSDEDAILTAYIARILASTRSVGPKDKSSKDEDAAIRRALDYVAAATNNFSDPYLYADYGLAEIAAGETSRAEAVLAKLRAAAQTQEAGSFWDLQANTPFYGWGHAGRVETTALAVQLLDKAGHSEDQLLINKGLEYLIAQKDRYGAWYSTQTTVNVIDALLLLASPGNAGIHEPLQIKANGSLRSVPVSPSQLFGPQVIDLSSLAHAGRNTIEISGGNSALTAQTVSDYYVPWSSTLAVPKAGPLKLDVKCDHTHMEVGTTATCNVLAERVGFAGYGMMVAEIGIPPGVEVDREALQKQISETGWELSSVDVLPDRIVAYVWPRAGGTKFSVSFKARMAMNAESAPHSLFDYYNPDASVTVAPDRFTVVQPAVTAAR